MAKGKKAKEKVQTGHGAPAWDKKGKMLVDNVLGTMKKRLNKDCEGYVLYILDGEGVRRQSAFNCGGGAMLSLCKSMVEDAREWTMDMLKGNRKGGDN